MKTDRDIQDDVIDELSWDPEVDAATIGVAVRDGSVTLSGRVRTYWEKLAAVKAAERVYAVRAVADELEVDLARGSVRDDSDIAVSVAHVIDHNTSLPEGAIKARVSNGFVTLEGEVEWPYQREGAEKAIRHITGVRGVGNVIAVKARTTPAQIEDAISAAFTRNASIDAGSVRAEVRDGNVQLYGHVHSVHERRVAERAAAAAPGVTSVENHIDITV
jgi:osmotically-inducible protein OsmY